MKEKTLYILITIVTCLVLAVGIAKADTKVRIDNKCDKVVDKIACYNKTQGADNEYRLAAWEDLKKLAIKRGYKLPKKVFLIDPVKEGRGIWDYKTYLKGNDLYFAPMQPCRHIDRKEGLRALRGLR